MLYIVERVRDEFYRDWSDTTLSVALLFVAAFVAAIALTSHSKLLKAAVLAYTILP